MAEATREYITSVVVSDSGAAVVNFSSNRSELVTSAFVYLPDPPDPLTKRMWDWAQTNPVKVYAVVALLGGVAGRTVPEWVNQLLTILL